MIVTAQQSGLQMCGIHRIFQAFSSLRAYTAPACASRKTSGRCPTRCRQANSTPAAAPRSHSFRSGTMFPLGRIAQTFGRLGGKAGEML